MEITDLDDLAHVRGMNDGRTFVAAQAARQRWPIRRPAQGSVRARVELGRLLADCPLPGCGGAELVSRVDKEFYCLACGMAGNDHSVMAVELPEEES